MNVDEKRLLIDRYAAGPKLIREALARVPDTAIHFRPSLEDAWTIAEHLNHLLDAEANGFVRYRKAVAEPGMPITAYDEERWAERLDYDAVDFSASLEAFGLIRKIAAAHLSSIIEDDWSGYFYEHPESGRVTIEQWLKIYADHVTVHLEYIERNLRLFSEK